MYDLALLYFRLALLTPYFNEYSIRDCLYLMSCVMLFMKGLAPFVQFCVATQLYHMSQSFFSFVLLSKMYCSATFPAANIEKAALFSHAKDGIL